MPTVGQTLREARTQRGIELRDAERVTKIRLKYLQAIEDDRWDVLPGEAYARGFLSTYAQFLGLDTRALLEDYGRSVARAQGTKPLPETMLPRPGARRRPGVRSVLVAVAALVALAAATLVLLTGGGADEGGKATPRPANRGGAGSPEPTTTREPPQRPSRVALELRATADVWVCLVDDRGRALVNGETLAAGESRGPFKARRFELTLGNGSIDVRVDDERIEVPAAAEPLGYRIGPNGAGELDESARPTCV